MLKYCDDEFDVPEDFCAHMDEYDRSTTDQGKMRVGYLMSGAVCYWCGSCNCITHIPIEPHLWIDGKDSSKRLFYTTELFVKQDTAPANTVGVGAFRDPSTGDDADKGEQHWVLDHITKHTENAQMWEEMEEEDMKAG